MADIRDPWAFINGRWHWTRFGYDRGWGRITFSDIDAHLEVNGKHLFVETKHWDGEGAPPSIPTGERIKYESLSQEGHWVMFVFGCGQCNDPRRIEVWFAQGPRLTKLNVDMTGTRDERRIVLKRLFDKFYATTGKQVAS